MNIVVISGNLTRDPNIKVTPSGAKVMDFSVAVNERRKNQQTGEWESVPHYVDCVIFGKRAESLGNILKKGMKVVVEGRLNYSSWERDGQRRSKLEVLANNIELPPRSQQPQQQDDFDQDFPF